MADEIEASHLILRAIELATENARLRKQIEQMQWILAHLQALRRMEDNDNGRQD